jgi:hypothetical protein
VTEESFTRAGYRALLETALASGYQFCPFDDPDSIAADRACFLRHDVDADPGAALELARLEHGLGVEATYFFMLRSPLYNLFGRENDGIVREILSLGHRLGLHQDVAFRPDGRTPQEWMELERELLERTFGVSVAAVSIHQPAGPVELHGVVNTYDLPGFEYVSDSNMAAREPSLWQLLRETRPPRLQLLIHPMWWIGDDPASTEMLWERAILANWERAQRQLLATERAYGEPRVLRIEQPE